MLAKGLLLILLAVAMQPAATAQPTRTAPADAPARPFRSSVRLQAAASHASATKAVAELLASSGGSNPRGFFASTERLSYNAAVAVDARGGVHLGFYYSDEQHQNDPLGQPAFYTYCPGTADCADPDNYGALIKLSSTQVNEVQIVTTAEGRPRLLVRRNGARGNDYHFWSCDEDCLNSERWVGLFVTEGMGVELFNTDLPQHSFALDSQERPRFVYSNSWGNSNRPNGVYYTWCDAADCTEPGSWQETKITFTVEFKTVTSDYASLVFDGDQPRVLFRYNESGLPVRMEYWACDVNCDVPSGWARTIITHPEGKQWANWDLALDAAGQPKIALYEAAGIDIRVGGKLFYGWCEEDCSDVNALFRIVQVAQGEGKNVDLTIDEAGRTYLVYDAGQRGVVGVMTCDGNCTSADSWHRQIVQTSEQLQEEFAPASPLNCAQNEQQGRAWLDAVPTTAFDGQGRLVVAYDVKNVAICYYTDPGDPTNQIWTKVERLWWATRFGFYTLSEDPAEPVAQIDPGQLTFPAVAVGQSAERTLTIKNASTVASLTGSVGAAPAPFAVTSGDGAFALAPGQSHVVTIRFAPTAAGDFSGAVAITHDAANLSTPVSIVLTGTAQAQASTVVLRHFDPEDTQIHLRVDGEFAASGSVFGTNRYGDRAKGTLMTLPAGAPSGAVTAVQAWFTYKRSGLTDQSYALELYDGTAVTGPVGEPLFSSTYPLADVVADDDSLTVSGPTSYVLDAPVDVGSAFFVVLDFGQYDETGIADAALASTEPVGHRVDEVWERWADGTWANVSDAWWSEAGEPGSGSDGAHIWVEATVTLGSGTPSEPEAALPDRLVLEPNYPNPFQTSTTIRFALPSSAHVDVVVYDALGRQVRRLLDQSLAAGTHDVAFEAGDLPSGLYVVRIAAGAAIETRRMVLLR